MGRLSGYRYWSSPKSTAESTINDLPLCPPALSRYPKSSSSSLAPTSKQVYSGLYLANNAVVDWRSLIDRMKLSRLGDRRFTPLLETPITLSNNESNCLDC